MLNRLELHGYRGFEAHEMDLRQLSVIVGHNNAGKSTIVEVLRIFSIITERLGGLNFHDPPAWTNLPLACRGLSPSLDGLGIQFSTISHRYGEDPASAKATFTGGESIDLFVDSEGRCFAVLRDSKSAVIATKGRATRNNFPSIQVLPQISPLDSEETILNPDYIRRNMSSPLASRHFRNQLKLLNPAYLQFRQLAQDSWPGIQILQLEGAKAEVVGGALRLFVRDRDFVAEIGLMGHGLQMWLQTVWFLSRTNAGATVVLDEPDVYMHPDLQRRLIRLVKNRFRQVVITTHSVEIVADLDPAEILIVDRSQNRSRFADTLPAVQSLIERIGGVHNVHLARLWHSQRFILVEGDDLSYLKAVHDKLYPQSSVPFDDIPNSSIGGWDGWPFAVGQSMFARNSLGQTLRVYCILDCDYHVPEELQERRDDARRRNVELYIWGRKEIENYFIIPTVIARVVCARAPEHNVGNISRTVEDRIHQIVTALRDIVFDGFATRFRDRNPKGNVAEANRQARELLEGMFHDPESALACVSGKEVLRQLSAWLHKKYGRGVSLRDILREIRAAEVPTEIQEVIAAIEHAGPFKRAAV
jgi:hypothetical protein